MKESPNAPSGSLSKTKYKVTIDDQEYQTSAFNEEGAISNAAFRYAEDNDEDVRLVRWKIREDKIDMEVGEV